METIDKWLLKHSFEKQILNKDTSVYRLKVDLESIFTVLFKVGKYYYVIESLDGSHKIIVQLHDIHQIHNLFNSLYLKPITDYITYQNFPVKYTQKDFDEPFEGGDYCELKHIKTGKLGRIYKGKDYDAFKKGIELYAVESDTYQHKFILVLLIDISNE